MNGYEYDEKLEFSTDGAITLSKPELRVAFVLMDKFTLIPVAGLVDSLRFAADKSFRSHQILCQWDWMTWNNEPVSASCGLLISPTSPLESLDMYDYIVICGGLVSETRNPPQGLVQMIKDAYEGGIPLVSLCSGSFVLGKAGLLDGKRCAVHFTIREEFQNRFPNSTAIINESYIDDEGIITCPGGTAIDLAAAMIRRHCGELRAQKGLKYLLVSEDEVKYVDEEHAHELSSFVYQNELVQRVISFMQSNLSVKLTLHEITDHFQTSPRQLHRLFMANTNMAPLAFWRRLRLENARRQLAHTDTSITLIAIDNGFSDASHFISWFRKEYGETPSCYRKRRHEVEALN